MRIAQISDIHVRNLKRHDDFRRTFDDLYRKLEELKPDRVADTGDTLHSKLASLTPESLSVTSGLFMGLSDIVPELDIILGNHDCSLVAKNRLDAISPIVASIDRSNIHLYLKSGRVPVAPGFNYWVFSMVDPEHYPTPADWAQFPDDVNVGLFHGSVRNCLTDSMWRMTSAEFELSTFDGLDAVLMGDIHKRQSFRDGRVAYAGSLLQQNFGEELEKGFLVWEFNGKDDITHRFVPLSGGRRFYTVKLDDRLAFPKQEVAPDSHVRLIPPRPLTLAEQKEAESRARKAYAPHDIITLSPTAVAQSGEKTVKKVGPQNLRELPVQEKLLRDYLKERSTSPRVVDRVLELNRRYQMVLDAQEDVARNVSWRLHRVEWDNVFNYGEGNYIDFSSLRGVTGIFAPNGAGKSNLIDVLTESLYDNVSKGISKNVHLINDATDVCLMKTELVANDVPYTVERSIERLKYGQRKLAETKEWGKTSVELSKVDATGEVIPLTEASRPETERALRRCIGTYDELMLTSVISQLNPLDIVSCKETERRRVLCRFLDLDVFEKKGLMAKEEAREHREQLRLLDDGGLEETLRKVAMEVVNCTGDLKKAQSELRAVKDAQEAQAELLVQLAGRKAKVDVTGDRPKVERELVLLRRQLVQSSELEAGQRETIARLTSEVTELDGLEGAFDLKAHDAARARMNQVEVELGVLERSLISLVSQQTASRKRSLLLREVPCGDSFPHCKFLVDAVSARDGLPSLSESMRDNEQRTLILREEKEALVPLVERMQQFHRDRASRDTKRANLNMASLSLDNTRLQTASILKSVAMNEAALLRLDEAADALRKNAEVDVEMVAVRKLQANLTVQVRDLETTVSRLTSRLGSEKGIQERLTAQLSRLQEVREACDAYERFGDAMGKDGISYRVLAQRLPLINEEVSKVLANCADFGVSVEDDPEEQTIRVFIQYGQYKPRLIELAGGAEKMLASIALRVALFNVSSLPRANFFVIDEGFGKLDPKNLEGISKAFEHLRSVFDHVLVISHIDAMKDAVDNIIDITTDENGFAHVEVGERRDDP